MGQIKVLLVCPPGVDVHEDEKVYFDSRIYPYSIVFLVNYLRKYHSDICEVDYMDLLMESRESLFSSVSNNGFDLIGFTSSEEGRYSTFDLIKKTRELVSESKIVVGGHFFSVTADAALAHLPEIDYVVRGEGEITLAELVKHLAGEKIPLSDINGLSWRSGSERVHNKPRAHETNPEKFIIDQDLVHKPGYDVLLPFRHRRDTHFTQSFVLMFSRGCNSNCIFCSLGGKFMPHAGTSVQSAIKQIKAVIDKYDVRYFMFTDISFCSNQAFVMEFCKSIIENKLDINWYCESRATISDEQMELMRKAGCIAMEIGLETGSEKIMRILKKRVSIKDFIRIAKKGNELDIQMSFFTMVSLPEETPEDLDQTYAVIREVAKYGMRAMVAPALIYPGTELERIAKNKVIMKKDFDWYDTSFRESRPFTNIHQYSMPHYVELLSEKNICDHLDRVHDLYFGHRTGRKIFHHAPHPIKIYKRLLKSISDDKRCSFRAPALFESPEMKKHGIYIRHDVFTRNCAEKMWLLVDVDLHIQAHPGVFVRADNVEYHLSEYRDKILAYKEKGVVFGLHTICYQDGDPINRLKKEIRNFEKELGFPPEGLTINDFAAMTNVDESKRDEFIARLTRSGEEFGFGFLDLPYVRGYDNVIHDCYPDDTGGFFIHDDFENLRFSHLLEEKGSNCLILTHPCYWK